MSAYAPAGLGLLAAVVTRTVDVCLDKAESMKECNGIKKMLSCTITNITLAAAGAGIALATGAAILPAVISTAVTTTAIWLTIKGSDWVIDKIVPKSQQTYWKNLEVTVEEIDKSLIINDKNKNSLQGSENQNDESLVEETDKSLIINDKNENSLQEPENQNDKSSVEIPAKKQTSNNANIPPQKFDAAPSYQIQKMSFDSFVKQKIRFTKDNVDEIITKFPWALATCRREFDSEYMEYTQYSDVFEALEKIKRFSHREGVDRIWALLSRNKYAPFWYLYACKVRIEMDEKMIKSLSYNELSLLDLELGYKVDLTFLKKEVIFAVFLKMKRNNPIRKDNEVFPMVKAFLDNFIETSRKLHQEKKIVFPEESIKKFLEVFVPQEFWSLEEVIEQFEFKENQEKGTLAQALENPSVSYWVRKYFQSQMLNFFLCMKSLNKKKNQTQNNKNFIPIPPKPLISKICVLAIKSHAKDLSDKNLY